MALMFLDGFQNIGLLILRLVLGVIFIYHSIPKLRFSADVGKALGKGTAFALILGLVEFLSGLAVIFGFYTQIAALLLGIVMLGALYYKIFVWKIPFAPRDKTGWEFDLILLAAALTLLLVGAGSISVDTILGMA